MEAYHIIATIALLATCAFILTLWWNRTITLKYKWRDHEVSLSVEETKDANKSDDMIS